MRKQIFSMTLEPKIIEVIERIAWENNTTKSAVARDLMNLVVYLPSEAFGKKSLLLEIFGFDKEGKNAE